MLENNVYHRCLCFLFIVTNCYNGLQLFSEFDYRLRPLQSVPFGSGNKKMFGNRTLFEKITQKIK